MNTRSTGFTPFVVLFEGRSGSTFLIEALDSHPMIHTEKEVFAIIRKRFRRRKAKLGARTQLQWARGFYRTPHDPDCRAVGFKTKRKDVLAPAEFRQLLADLGARVIRLQRRNLVKQVVSLANGRRLRRSTGDWNLYRIESRSASFRIRPEKFSVWLSALEQLKKQLEEYVASFDLPTLPIHYEDLLVDPQGTFRKVCRFLDVTDLPLTSPVRKNTSDDLRDALENFDELRTAYAGTPYEAMFDEILVPNDR